MPDLTAAERDAFYRAQIAARLAFERMRHAALAGDDTAAAAVTEAWEPIRAFQRESQRHERQRDQEERCVHVN